METLIPDRRRWWILAVVIGGQFMFVVDAFIVNVAIPAIRTDLAGFRWCDRGGDRDLSGGLRHAGHHRWAAG